MYDRKGSKKGRYCKNISAIPGQIGLNDCLCAKAFKNSLLTEYISLICAKTCFTKFILTSDGIIFVSNNFFMKVSRMISKDFTNFFSVVNNSYIASCLLICCLDNDSHTLFGTEFVQEIRSSSSLSSANEIFLLRPPPNFKCKLACCCKRLGQEIE
ncbi:hypothetical protein AWRI1631_72950 [Saccharomyces cerevisiae AWRI1631]|uniref:Uncharacterized protein n=1 Tax=Saccharomyces cerevisiae (strain AWRI1631) TaxID=545124 RepID=B5VJ16_YEAS6|nr:hypothetical protein AWRI1631_72950 [Saccharomyces cerevisiae AWRI1631]